LHRSPLTSSRLEHPLYATFHPDRFDVTGAVVCLIGVAVIMYAPR
jgi:drug/metabolite transporter superfamily protein YnfA